MEGEHASRLRIELRVLTRISTFARHFDRGDCETRRRLESAHFLEQKGQDVDEIRKVILAWFLAEQKDWLSDK